jgi:hypothetical protein
MNTQFMEYKYMAKKKRICNPMLDHILLYRAEALVLLLSLHQVLIASSTLVMAIAPTNKKRQ